MVLMWIVQLGELWDCQFGVLIGWCQEIDFIVVKIEMVKLMKKQIVDVTGFQIVIIIIVGDRSVGVKVQLLESEVVKLLVYM